MRLCARVWVLAAGILAYLSPLIDAQAQCGTDAGGALCPSGVCCSQFGFCGTSIDYCGSGCQSQCVLPSPPPPPSPPEPPVVSTSGLDKTVNESLFDALFPNRDPFYTYNAFIEAGNAFPKFGTEGIKLVKLREIAAFAAHVQQETAGLFYLREIDQSFNYCDATNTQYPCVAGQKYFGRGPLQLSWNYNYGPFGVYVGVDLLSNPDLVATNNRLAFKSALYFWMTKSGSIPSIHDVLVGKYVPSIQDIKALRFPGFGLTIDIINGNDECGKVTPQAENRVKYFKEFTTMLNTYPGPFLNCSCMKPFA